MIKCLIDNIKKKKNEKEHSKYIGSVPYFPKICSMIQRILKQHNLQIVIKVSNMKNSMLNNKNKLEAYTKQRRMQGICS